MQLISLMRNLIECLLIYNIHSLYIISIARIIFKLIFGFIY